MAGHGLPRLTVPGSVLLLRASGDWCGQFVPWSPRQAPQLPRGSQHWEEGVQRGGASHPTAGGSTEQAQHSLPGLETPSPSGGCWGAAGPCRVEWTWGSVAGCTFSPPRWVPMTPLVCNSGGQQLGALHATRACVWGGSDIPGTPGWLLMPPAWLRGAQSPRPGRGLPRFCPSLSLDGSNLKVYSDVRLAGPGPPPTTAPGVSTEGAAPQALCRQQTQARRVLSVGPSGCGGLAVWGQQARLPPSLSTLWGSTETTALPTHVFPVSEASL